LNKVNCVVSDVISVHGHTVWLAAALSHSPHRPPTTVDRAAGEVNN